MGDESEMGREGYNTLDDDSLIQDMKVLQALRANGDIGETPRRVDHWAYFPNRAAAAAFETWIASQGYTSQGIERANEATNPFQIRFHRLETPSPGDFTSANVDLRRRAKELGGAYDGWETLVIKVGVMKDGIAKDGLAKDGT